MWRKGTNPVFVTLPLQNRFQALLDEIIQQEEREMEQVKTLIPDEKRECMKDAWMWEFLLFS